MLASAGAASTLVHAPASAAKSISQYALRTFAFPARCAAAGTAPSAGSIAAAVDSGSASTGSVSSHERAVDGDEVDRHRGGTHSARAAVPGPPAGAGCAGAEHRPGRRRRHACRRLPGATLGRAAVGRRGNNLPQLLPDHAELLPVALQHPARSVCPQPWCAARHRPRRRWRAFHGTGDERRRWPPGCRRRPPDAARRQVPERLPITGAMSRLAGTVGIPTSLDYFDYNLNENGRAVAYGHRAEDYLTDVLARKATASSRSRRPTAAILRST